MTRMTEPGSVHRVVGDVLVLAVRRERRLDRTALHRLVVLRIAVVGQRHPIGNRLAQCVRAVVVHRDRVLVDHVLRRDQPGTRCIHRLRCDAPGDGLEPGFEPVELEFHFADVAEILVEDGLIGRSQRAP